MIYYNGSKTVKNVHFLLFKNEKNEHVEIPVDKIVLKQMEAYLNKLQPPKLEVVERGNDEEPL